MADGTSASAKPTGVPGSFCGHSVTVCVFRLTETAARPHFLCLENTLKSLSLNKPLHRDLSGPWGYSMAFLSLGLWCPVPGSLLLSFLSRLFRELGTLLHAQVPGGDSDSPLAV